MGSKSRLNEYIASVKDKPFVWGEHDCLIFSNNAFKAFHGFGYADDWIGRYMNDRANPLRRKELMLEFGFNSIEKALDNRMMQIPQRTQAGALVTCKKYNRWITGVALGLSVGSRCLFLNKEGIFKINVEETDKAWWPNGEQ